MELNLYYTDLLLIINELKSRAAYYAQEAYDIRSDPDCACYASTAEWDTDRVASINRIIAELEKEL